MMRLAVVIGFAVAFLARGEEESPIYLVTGATGRSGSIIYSLLKSKNCTTRALVRPGNDPSSILGCSACDESDGVYYGDVTNKSSLVPAMDGVSFLAIAVGVSGGTIDDMSKDVEWKGVENQVSALGSQAVSNGRPLTALGVALIGSMGSTDPNPSPFGGGSILFWKLQAEAFLSSSAVPFVIVNPCGLQDGPGAQTQLLVGHDDDLLGPKALLTNGPTVVDREDVARVLVHALTSPRWRPEGLRFDLCSTKHGDATQNDDAVLDALCEQALWPWAQAQAA
eukprot:CAMPEP_0172614998 /NCGR_PEP_ID=MMETSP1068-20121228/55764_1 /TAXON_ID=35684 /ORGANISM="Pseudopedinella elastica, Strain CCMP716" /LENGTH=280 /DNA_ID=CAMNT_0013419985 /DNA_START=8 /DNA_END=850 /DNA_ORIENTATION=-